MVFLQESVGWRRWAGMLLAFSGVMYISFDPDAFTYLTGMLFGVMAAVSGSVASIFMRLVKDIKPFEMQAWIVMISWPPLLFLSLTVEQDIPTILANVTWVGWGAVAFAALVSNLFAHAGMFFLLQRYEVSFIAPLTLMAPIFTIILSVAFLGDAFTLRMFIGAAVTTLGVLIITLRRPAEAVRVEEVSH
jgi:O-acetylserine/cysteine efflux transporter